MTTSVLLRSCVLGVVTGGRSASGMAALAVCTSPGSGRLVALSSRTGTALAACAALGELAADKLPSTPSRLEPPVLAVRVGAGAIAGGALARREGARVVLPAAAGGLGALAGSYAGATWRSTAGRRRPDWQGALVEDAAVLLLAAWAARARS